MMSRTGSTSGREAKGTDRLSPIDDDRRTVEATLAIWDAMCRIEQRLRSERLPGDSEPTS